MTSTGTYKGLQDGRNSSKVLKPPGGGSSDIFGSGSEVNSPRRVKPNVNQSQLGSSFFGNGDQAQSPSSNGSSAPETPRSKPGNDSYKRLFGPPDAPPPSTPNKNHMRSNIPLSADSSEPNSPTRSIGTPSSDANGIGNGHLANTNGYHHNDVIDGNPVTGAGYEPPAMGIQQNGNGGASSDKSSTDSSPSAVGGVTRMKNRVPPGGFSSGLW